MGIGMRLGIKPLVVLGAFVFSFSVFAANEQISTTAEKQRKIGTNVGIGDPFPGLIGLNVGYNLTDDIRATAGYAEVEVTTSIGFSSQGITQKTVKAQTYAIGGQYLFTDWALRPTAGLHLGYFSISGDGDFDLNGFEESTVHFYSNAGFDWITNSGFHMATGMNLALAGGSGTGFYANFGYFF